MPVTDRAFREAYLVDLETERELPESRVSRSILEFELRSAVYTRPNGESHIRPESGFDTMGVEDDEDVDPAIVELYELVCSR